MLVHLTDQTPKFIVTSLWDILEYSVWYQSDETIILNLEHNYAQEVIISQMRFSL